MPFTQIEAISLFGDPETGHATADTNEPLYSLSHSTTRLAIDIVILPPEQVMDLAIEWNKHLAKKHLQSILLGKTISLPHISLLMGCLAKNQMASAHAALTDIANGTKSLDLRITRNRDVGEVTSPVVTLDIESTPALLSLHENIVDTFKSLLTQDAKASEIDDTPPITHSSLKWISNFMADQCHENFWPHITVGHGNSEKVQTEYNFTATRLAIFHLGNHCTCKTLLFETTLKD
ncbi:MAG: 2'-5' RNA ligase family protein [Chryseolinea sp.]